MRHYRVFRYIGHLALSFLPVLTFAFEVSAAALTEKDHDLERNGVKLFLHSYIDESKPPIGNILLVHGLTFSSHEFDIDFEDYSLTRWLAGQGYAVWILDIAGYARSGVLENGFQPDSDYAAEDINAAVDYIIKASGQSKIDVLGWSWGTVTGGRFAAKYPEKIRSLVLYAPIVAGLDKVYVTDAFKTEPCKGADEDFQRNESGVIDPAITDDGVVKLFAANCLKYDNHPVPNGGRRDLFVSPNNRLIPTAQIKVPTLLIVGSKDSYVSIDLVKEAASTFPGGAELRVFKDAGHSLYVERPHYKEFRESVFEFITRQPN
ncbi:MAG: alpha/beta hydrolase [Deltaproteobacteria bacterium]|jgi:pimeloyl-ACP methyl ester carboxylesterase|nr:alpha/beta hydrolase [Deltaproteobacteria bacterium]